MGSSAPQEGSPFPVWRRHTHAGSNCSMREVLLWLRSACGRPIIRAPHSIHVHGRLPPPLHGFRCASLPLVQRRSRCLRPRQNPRRPQEPPIKPPALLDPGNKRQTCPIHASRKGRSTSQTRSVCRTAQGSLGYLFDIFHELLECGTVG